MTSNFNNSNCTVFFLVKLWNLPHTKKTQYMKELFLTS